MINENEPERAENENGPAFTVAVIFIVLILLTICTLGVKLLSHLVEPGQTPTQVVPVTLPTEIPTVIPLNSFPIYLPIIQSEPHSIPVTGAEQIWKVTKINNLGYELDGQRYDLATFMRVDSQDTAEAYCIDRGVDQPEIGTDYWLNAEGIFIPLNEPNARPIQRFLKIQ